MSFVKGSTNSVVRCSSSNMGSISHEDEFRAGLQKIPLAGNPKFGFALAGLGEGVSVQVKAEFLPRSAIEIIFPDQPSFYLQNATSFICHVHDKRMWVMVPRLMSGLIDGYKERLWLTLHLIFLQSSIKAFTEEDLTILGPLRCKIFIWFEVLNCCWTADRLSKLGLPHPTSCPFCDKPHKPLTIC